MTSDTNAAIAAAITAGATIFAAILTCISSIVTSINVSKVTKQGNKENKEANEKLNREIQESENKRNEKQIDANIIWNARIEWIQNVRRVSAGYISKCYRYIRFVDENLDKNNEVQEQLLNAIEEESLLLKLYFGPDSQINEKEKAKNLFDEKNNHAKNAMIIELINEINSRIPKYRKIKIDIKEKRKNLADCARCEGDSSAKQYICVTDEYGSKFTETECNYFKSYADKKLSEYYSECQKLHQCIKTLSESLRIYLKLEWNRAKNRDSI